MKTKSRLAAVGLAATLLLVGALPAAADHALTEQQLALDALAAVAPDIASSANTNPKNDFAVGGGQHNLGTVNEGFAAHSGPQGENPQGHISATFAQPQPQKIRAKVICLHVVGNQAFILGQQTLTTETLQEGDLILLHVVDNGNPIQGTPPDAIRNAFLPGGFIPPPQSGLMFPCGQPLLPPVPLEKGNIVVHNAQP